MKSFRSRKMLNGTRSHLYCAFRMTAAAGPTNVRQTGTVIPRSYRPRKNIGCRDPTTSFLSYSVVDFVDRRTLTGADRRGKPHARAGANGETENKTSCGVADKSRGNIFARRVCSGLGAS